MWRSVNYETCGRGHKKMSIPCQDKTISYNNNNVNIIALADGAGSAKFSHYGAEVVLEAVSKFISNNFDLLINNPNGVQVKQDILTHLIEKLNRKSQELCCDMKDLASTLLLVAIKENSFLICHVGDGIIGYLKEDELKVASKPENGEFVNTTTFVTSKNAVMAMKLFKGKLDNINGFVLMSDGTAESFYSKKDSKLAPILVKIMHKNAILEPNIIFENIKESFDNIVVNNTFDDCSIAIISRSAGILYDYKDMDIDQKCNLLDIEFGSYSYKKRINRYDDIINFLESPKTLDQISRELYLKKKYMKKYVNKLTYIGVIVKEGNKYKKV